MPPEQPSASKNKPTLSVSELNQFARGALEKYVGNVWVSGEVSNFSQPASGHWYFTLKDDNAQIRCAMFKHKNQLIRNRIHSGMQILLNGNVSLYEGRGDYQLIADYLEESGLGSMAKAFEALKAKLNQEGLFSQAHKQLIPKTLKHIAVITSETGAAVHDILSVLKERFPALHITLIPASVQGENAPLDLIKALKQAYRYNQVKAIDAVIIGRGGGSTEDLWAFNNERLARAIYAFPIPIISAVGHEVDISICDLVADVRAPTPSAAAEMISPDQDHLRQQLDYIEQRLEQAINNKLLVSTQQLNLHQMALQHPQEKIQHFHQAFAQSQLQLHKSVTAQLQQKQWQLSETRQKLKAQNPKPRLEQQQLNVRAQQQKIVSAMQTHLQTQRNQLAQQASALELISPLATLSRGYSISKTIQGDIIRDSQQVKVDDQISITLANGAIQATIKDIKSATKF